ncbi:MAG TPA: IS4 family transposase [Leptolyngbyaceae cyanobacterium]
MAGHRPPSMRTGAYARARQRLPEKVVQRLFEQTGAALSAKAQAQHLWLGHVVKVLDGSTVLMSDTAANQAAYPQHPNQRPGCGFPIAQVVGMFCLATGAAIGVQIAAWKTSEIALARAWYSTLQPNDVVLADRAYGSYVDLVLVQQRRADGVFRLRQARRTDFAQAQSLGKQDYLVSWSRPQSRPKTMTPAHFDTLPDTLLVRVVFFSVERPGWRAQTITLVTTLRDPNTYSKTQLAALYGLRWQVEVNLKHLKTTLTMDMLKARSPAMVRKEIWVHLMAYNLLRDLMWQAATDPQQDPLRLSLKGTQQAFNHWRPLLANAQPPIFPHYRDALLCQATIQMSLGRQLVG